MKQILVAAPFAAFFLRKAMLQAKRYNNRTVLRFDHRCHACGTQEIRVICEDCKVEKLLCYSCDTRVHFVHRGHTERYYINSEFKDRKRLPVTLSFPTNSDIHDYCKDTLCDACKNAMPVVICLHTACQRKGITDLCLTCYWVTHNGKDMHHVVDAYRYYTSIYIWAWQGVHIRQRLKLGRNTRLRRHMTRNQLTR